MNFEEISKIIENSIAGLSVDPLAARGDKEGRWNLTRKGAAIWIDAFSFPNNPEFYYFQVMSPLFKVTELLKTDIQQDLLEFAYTMYGCSICKKESWYYVFNLREAEDLNQKEVDRSIDRVGHYSNDIYEKFKFKYPKAFEEGLEVK